MTAPALRLRQVCLVSHWLAPVVQALQDILGLPVCHRDPAVTRFGLENALFALGSSFLEFVAPAQAGTAAGRFLARSGAPGQERGGEGLSSNESPEGPGLQGAVADPAALLVAAARQACLLDVGRAGRRVV